MKHLRLFALALVLASTAFATTQAGSARAADAPGKAASEAGRVHFLRGVALFKDADFRAALIEFKKAYEIAPNYRVEYNIGQTCLELQDYGCALSAFQKYLAEGGSDVPAARKKEVEKEVTRLSSLVAHVRIVASKEGAEIAVDDVVVGRGPLSAPLLVGAGRHKFSAQLAPFLPATKVVDVASGDDLEVKLDLADPQPAAVPVPVVVPAPTPAPVGERAAPVKPPPPPPEAPSRAPFYIGLTSTAVLTGATVAFGVVSLGAKSSLDDKAGQVGVTPAEMDSARTKVETFSLVTDVVGATAIVAGVVTTVLYFTTSPKSGSERGARLVPSPFGLAGTF